MRSLGVCVDDQPSLTSEPPFHWPMRKITNSAGFSGAEKSDRAGGDALNRIVTGIDFFDEYTRRKVFRHDALLVCLRQGEIGGLEMTRNTSEVALCCSSGSPHSGTLSDATGTPSGSHLHNTSRSTITTVKDRRTWSQLQGAQLVQSSPGFRYLEGLCTTERC
jgi:hypothetical protein